ncbi:hypothetical protein AB205_0126890 [Aquarana catesbeiana]|uniref:Uncharacterized protein n=1 Tax=Aquarana catesbeiana TaxID=8400 RepID=A0A2G9R606_AQUCT|nr:hypothetical protein AB205_0126890 [Aquarana catesbeiana]
MCFTKCSVILYNCVVPFKKNRILEKPLHSHIVEPGFDLHKQCPTLHFNNNLRISLYITLLKLSFTRKPALHLLKPAYLQMLFIGSSTELLTQNKYADPEFTLYPDPNIAKSGTLKLISMFLVTVNSSFGPSWSK